MGARFQVTFDCADPDAQATFWALALDYVVQPPPPGHESWEAFLAAHGMAERLGMASAIVDPEGVGPRIFFQRVPEPKTEKNRVHLDLNIAAPRRLGSEEHLDPEERQQPVDAAVARLVGLGATRIHSMDEYGDRWTVMLDPEGNEFCVH